MTRRVVAREDPRLAARVVAHWPLNYAAGADATVDRPAHVRAGSSLAWAGDRLVVVQDDANFLALVDPRDASVHVTALPAGAGGRRQFDDGRGNKRFKLDLEAVASVPAGPGAPLVVALGSGSSARRERVVVARGLTPDGIARDRVDVRVHRAAGLYAALRELVTFAGSELNVEAAVLLRDEAGERLRLFNRGNGAARGEVRAVDATCEVDWPALLAHLEEGADAPAPRHVVQYRLGEIDGGALAFTDATLVRAPADRERHILYTAAAEASPDATRDGPVAGCAIGLIVEGEGAITARWTALVDTSGERLRDKVEGIAVDPVEPTRLWVVVDRDEPELPSRLCEVRLEGPWFDRA